MSDGHKKARGMTASLNRQIERVGLVVVGYRLRQAKAFLLRENPGSGAPLGSIVGMLIEALGKFTGEFIAIDEYLMASSRKRSPLGRNISGKVAIVQLNGEG